jgi:hypothetical protein
MLPFILQSLMTFSATSSSYLQVNARERTRYSTTLQLLGSQGFLGSKFGWQLLDVAL